MQSPNRTTAELPPLRTLQSNVFTTLAVALASAALLTGAATAAQNTHAAKPRHTARPSPVPTYTPRVMPAASQGPPLKVSLTAYPLKDALQLNASITNMSLSGYSVEFPSTARVDFIAMRGSCPIWHAVAGAQQPGAIYFQSMQAQTFATFLPAYVRAGAGTLRVRARFVSRPRMETPVLTLPALAAAPSANAADANAVNKAAAAGKPASVPAGQAVVPPAQTNAQPAAVAAGTLSAAPHAPTVGAAPSPATAGCAPEASASSPPAPGAALPSARETAAPPAGTRLPATGAHFIQPS